MSSFKEFELSEEILKVLQEIDFVTPTPIQQQAIPKILQGKDIIASAQTGTGKTAAFILPILHMLTNPKFRGNMGPQVLIIVPTRELAMQVADEAKKFSKYMFKTKTVCIYGGIPYPVQKRALAGRYEILVATPGRLIDLMNQKRVDLSQIKLLVLDEADRMLDMGFIEPIENIVSALNPERQTLLFSATIDKKILPLSKRLQNNAHEIKVAHSETTQNNIEQRLYYVDGVSHKIRILDHLLAGTEISQAIVFASTIRQAITLADYLYNKGHASEALHGDMNQRQRTRAINQLRTGNIRFLIATDVASRGIDVPALSHIINFDLPMQSEDFVHRIGRTGRAGATGTAITFATHKEKGMVSKINKLMGKPITLHTIEGMEPKIISEASSNRPSAKRRSQVPGFSRNGGGRRNNFSRSKY